MKHAFRLYLALLVSAVASLGAADGKTVFETPPKIVFEAESAKAGPPFRITKVAQASGGKVLAVVPDPDYQEKDRDRAGRASVQYKFAIPRDGKHRLWFRVSYPRELPKGMQLERTEETWQWLGKGYVGSFAVSVSGRDTKAPSQVLEGSIAGAGKLIWLKLPKRLQLRKGEHVLRIDVGRPGFSLDQIAVIGVEEGVGEKEELIPVGIERSYIPTKK